MPKLCYYLDFLDKGIAMLRSKLFGLVWAMLLAYPNFMLADELAVKNFETAISFCERGILADMPLSSGSWRILRSYWVKYQHNMQNALNREPTLLGPPLRMYSGNYFMNKNFAEIKQRCDAELPEKLRNAQLQLQSMQLERQQNNIDIQQLQEGPSKPVEAIFIPKTPPPSPAALPKPDIEPDNIDDYSYEDEDPDYQHALQTLQGKRLEILKSEQRMPDFISDEDMDLGLSDKWLYEEETDAGFRCITYTFGSNDALLSKQEQNNECPPIW